MTEIIERPRSFSDTAKDIARRIFRYENAVLTVALIAVIGGLGVITKGLTIRRVNMLNVLLQSAIRGVAALGQAFCLLSANVDLSIGGVGLVCSVLGASLMTQTPYLNIVGHPVSIYIAIPIMLLMGAGWGITNGASVSRIGMNSIIVTLAMWEITKGVAFQISGGQSFGRQPESLAFFGSGTVAGIPVPVIIFITLAVTTYFVLSHTAFGRAVYATGGNPVSAWLSGINVKNIILMVYVISGFFGGLAGILVTARTMSASMRSLMGLEIDSIAACFIGGVSLVGGRGSIIGVVLGILIISVVNNGMSVLGASPAIQGIVKGVIIFTAIAIDCIRRRRG